MGTKTSVMAKLVAHEGKGDELVAAFKEQFAQVDDEAGTEVYVLNRADDDRNVFWFYELYADADSAKAHARSEVMKRTGAALQPLLASFEMIIGAPVQAKGLSLG